MQEFLLYTTRTSIHHVDLTDNRDVTMDLRGLQNVIAIEYDYGQDCIYWADVNTRKLQVWTPEYSDSVQYVFHTGT